MVTPFRADGRVNEEAAVALGRHLLANGSDGLVVCGTTGESPTLTDDEMVSLVTLMVDELGDEALIAAGAGSNATHHACHLVERMAQAGAQALLSVTGYYNRPNRRGIVRHYEEVARAAGGTRVIVYNIPSRVVINIEPDTFTRLAEIENVRAVKQAHDDLAHARHIVSLGLDLYAGDDNIFLPFLELGGAGGICVHTHVVGPQVAEQARAVREGDLERARGIDRELAPVYELLKVTTNPIAIKAALNLTGHDVGDCRLPLVPPTDEELARVRDCLARLGLLVAA
jgi:4-hydroxy-tetrahydrodipicolinate synthase